MHSCIYVGQVGHRRFAPTEHRFRYRLYMLYLDLGELPTLIDQGVLRKARFAPLSFRPEDHRVSPERTLAEAVGDLVEEQTGNRPAGPIRLLTGLRCFGYYFSPLNLYYCFGRDGKAVETVVAEVSNTPWRETHYYVLSDVNRIGRSGELRFAHPKGFHVSPFMGMDMQYEWQLSQPDSQLTVQIANRKESDGVFEASLVLDRRQLSKSRLVRLLLRYPWMTGRIMAGIYYQAFRLWRKKCPYYPHPEHHDQPAGIE